MSLPMWHSAKIIVALLLLSAAVPAAAQEFFNGKTVVVLVGTAAGGGFDTYSRMMARHLGKHIPGNPSIIVQNMPGAGQLIAAQGAQLGPGDSSMDAALIPHSAPIVRCSHLRSS